MATLELLPNQRTILKSKARARLAAGGWGGGKTYCGSVFALHQATNFKWALGLICANTYNQLAKSTLKPFCDIMDLLGIKWAYGRKPQWPTRHKFVDYANVLSIADGSSILCFSGERPEAVLGVTAGWAWLDECGDMDLEFWNNVQSRIRDPQGSGMTFVTTSVPLAGPAHWLYEKFIDPAKKLADSETITLKTKDNIHNQDGYYDRLLADLGSSLAQVLLEGDWINLQQGRAFEFDRAKNAAACKIQEGLPLILSMDQNVQPMAGVIMQVDKQKRMAWVLDEIWIENNASTRQAAMMFASKYASWRGDVLFWADASSAKRDTREGVADQEILKQTLKPYFPSVREGSDRRQRFVFDGVAAVNAMLNPAIGDPRLAIDPKCINLIRDLESLRWEAGSRKLDKDSNPKLSHSTDSLRYVIGQTFPCLAGGVVTGVREPGISRVLD